MASPTKDRAHAGHFAGSYRILDCWTLVAGIEARFADMRLNKGY